jgi:hypothetical protein
VQSRICNTGNGIHARNNVFDTQRLLNFLALQLLVSGRLLGKKESKVVDVIIALAVFLSEKIVGR